MIVSAILLCVAAFAKGELGMPGYPVWDQMGINPHGNNAALVRAQPAARVVVQGNKGGFVHGGRVVASGVKGGAVIGHNAGLGVASVAGWGAGAGKQQVVYPAPKKQQVVYPAPKKQQVVYPAPKKQQVVYPAPKQQVVYPAPKKSVGASFVSGGAGWGAAGGLKKVVGARLVSAGGAGFGGVVSSGGSGWGVSSGKGAVYPAAQKKVVVSAGGSYPHGNAQAVGGHGYFPDVAPGLQGYGKGVYYKQVANVGPMAVSCPYGWQYYHGSCYYFSRDRLSWWEAYAKCTFMGGYLAMVNYAHENSYLKLMCKKMHFDDGAWFGLNDILFPKTHTWYWGFGKKGCKWFDWFGKGPKYRGADNNCVCFKEDYHYQWGVNSCQTKMYYVCELNPKMPCKCGY